MPSNIISSNEPDLVFYHAGTEQCVPGHTWKSVRDHFLFHYIVAGKGRVRYGFTDYYLNAGSGFVFFPGDLNDYLADFQEPWHYVWCGFAGRSAENLISRIGLTRRNPIYVSDVPNDLDPLIEPTVTLLGASQSHFQQMELLYRVLSLLNEYGRKTAVPEFTAERQNYIDAEFDYIKANYQRASCSVAAMATRLGLNRSYLTLLTKRKTGKTPCELLISYRMYKAREYLTTGELSVAAVAEAVGYRDAMTFSRAFHQWAGCSPLKYRQQSYSFKKIIP